MNNTYFNMKDTITEENYTFSNIFASRKNQNITNTFITDNPHYWYYKDIQDDTRLEVLSYFEYNDSKYWDLLFYINDMDSIFDLPTNGDNIIAKVNSKVQDFETKFGIITDIVIKNQQYDTFLSEVTILNEKHRRFRFIKPSYISQFLGYLNGL